MDETIESGPADRPAPDGSVRAALIASAISADSPAPPDAPAAAEAPGEPESEPPIDPPISWSAEDKAAFAALPRAVQETIVRREGERERAFHDKSEKIATALRRYDALDQVLAPHRQRIQMAGLDETRAVQQLLAASEYLDRAPEEAIRWLAQARGVDIDRLSTPPADRGNAAPARDSASATGDQPGGELPGEVAQLARQVDEHARALHEWQGGFHQAAQRSAEQSMLSEIEQFAGEAGADGAPLRPHLQTVLADMVPIVAALRTRQPQAGARELLEAAYERATWGHPEARKVQIAALMDAERQREQAKRMSDAGRAARQAQRASVSISGAPTAPSSGPRGRSVRQLLEQAAAGAA